MTIAPLDIRCALTGDAPLMRAIASAAYHPYIEEIGHPPAPMLADFDTHIAEDICFMLWIQGRACGYAIILEKSDGFWLENIAVHPDQQGNGFGNLLLQAVEDFLSRHTDRYQLYTNIVIRENVHWYKWRGFNQTKGAVDERFHRLYFQKMLS